MFHNVVLFMALAVQEPAAFRLDVEASPHSDYGIRLNGQELNFNQLYRTQPLTRSVRMELELWFVNGDEVVRQRIPLELNPGYVTRIIIQIPRVFPTITDI